MAMNGFILSLHLTQYEPDKDSIMVYSAMLEWLLILVKV